MLLFKLVLYVFIHRVFVCSSVGQGCVPGRDRHVSELSVVIKNFKFKKKTYYGPNLSVVVVIPSSRHPSSPLGPPSLISLSYPTRALFIMVPIPSLPVALASRREASGAPSVVRRVLPCTIVMHNCHVLALHVDYVAVNTC
jgi:hypothetical protein